MGKINLQQVFAVASCKNPSRQLRQAVEVHSAQLANLEEQASKSVRFKVKIANYVCKLKHRHRFHLDNYLCMLLASATGWTDRQCISFHLDTSHRPRLWLHNLKIQFSSIKNLLVHEGEQDF